MLKFISSKKIRRAASGAFLLVVLSLVGTARAQTPAEVLAPSTVVPNANASFTYDYSITNATTMDLAIITVPVATGSMLMNLTAPAGFGISFDPGVGLVSFFEDTNPATATTFAPLTTVTGFSFTSFYAPGTVTFDALDVSGNDYTGPTAAPTTVPEPTSVVSLLAGLTLFGGFIVRRRACHYIRFCFNKFALTYTLMKKSQTSNAKRCTPFLFKGIKLSAGAALAATALFAPVTGVQASSHSDAPLIKLDPQANLTDVYAFIRTRPANGEKVLVCEVSVRPFSEPGDGGEYEAFSPDALYSIHIANPTTGAEVQRYDFQFSATTPNGGNYKNTNTILRYGRGADINGAPDAGAIQTVGDAHQNFVQSYTVTSTINGTRTVLNGTSTLLVPPPNVGNRVTPRYNNSTGQPISGAANRAALDPYTNQTTYDIASGGTTYTFFAGPREDGFYSDIPGIFDLLNGRILNNDGDATDGFGQDGGGIDGFKGFNVLHYAIVIPVSALPSFTYTGALQPASTGVGVYASVSRPRVTLRQTNANDTSSGPFIQVNREANPLFNEALVALADKDNYNRSSPTNDATNFAKYALNPELAALINTVFGTTFATSGRVDLQAIYIPDVIRVNTTTGATTVAGDAAFSRLSFIGNDTIANGAGVQIPAGWPNGRRLGDDIVDIALTALASGPSFTTITVVGDNAATNDQVYNHTFPYAGTPNSGTRNSKDSGTNVGISNANKAKLKAQNVGF